MDSSKRRWRGGFIASGLIERVRSDRGLGRYSSKMVCIPSGGAARGFCHLGMIESLERVVIRLPDAKG